MTNELFEKCCDSFTNSFKSILGNKYFNDYILNDIWDDLGDDTMESNWDDILYLIKEFKERLALAIDNPDFI